MLLPPPPTLWGCSKGNCTERTPCHVISACGMEKRGGFPAFVDDPGKVRRGSHVATWHTSCPLRFVSVCAGLALGFHARKDIAQEPDMPHFLLDDGGH